MTEQQAYEVVRRYPEFELRRYAPHVVAQVVVDAPFEDAGNRAFRTLLGYISGQNRSASKVAMTAPVIQSGSTRLPMTEPVEQTPTGEGSYAVAFVLPSSVTLADAPTPTSPEVRLHERPAALGAARRYRGRWTESSFEEHRRALEAAVRAAGLTPVGAPRWARFDPPFMPWFLRRNEVVQDVVETASSTSGP
ncbi:heme-binding protein [Terrabacter carboxydivorans]|uniref:Heme-binding protein n=1 Tax=Terrabacter carboxydivorans TaxID=619730 RepID=A0ABN3M9P9_9MICO